MPLTKDEAIEQLSNRSSAKRRSAAKRLRSLAIDDSGPALLSALRTEVLDPRTWETQYQMIMALGACRYEPAAPFLEDLARAQAEPAMVGVALGDALTRLDWAGGKSLSVVSEFLPDGGSSVLDGMFRSIAMQQLVPEEALVDRIIAFASGRPLKDGLRFWVAAAAAGWTGDRVQTYLRECLESQREETVQAARESLSGTYGKYNPL